MTSAVPSDTEYGSVSSLAEKLDRIELENALASAAMRQSRPFHPQSPFYNLLTYAVSKPGSEPGINSGSSGYPISKSGSDTVTGTYVLSKSGSETGFSSGSSGYSTPRLEPIRERLISVQTPKSESDNRRNQGSSTFGHKITSASVICSAGSGGFSVSISPGAGGQLNLSVHGQGQNLGSSGGYPNKMNVVLPSPQSDCYSYSISSAGGITCREDPRSVRFSLPPTYEESVREKTSPAGYVVHPRSSSLDELNKVRTDMHAAWVIGSMSQTTLGVIMLKSSI